MLRTLVSETPTFEDFHKAFPRGDNNLPKPRKEVVETLKDRSGERSSAWLPEIRFSPKSYRGWNTPEAKSGDWTIDNIDMLEATLVDTNENSGKALYRDKETGKFFVVTRNQEAYLLPSEKE